MAFSATAQTGSIKLSDSHTLTARFLHNGEWRESYLDLNDHIGNIDGKFAWDGRGYSHTATNISLLILSDPSRVYLYATLKRKDASYEEAGIDLNEGVANVNGQLKYKSVSKSHPPPPRASALVDHILPSYEQNNTLELSSSQAKGTVTNLPPHNPLCTAFAAMFTEPNGRQLCFTACPIIAVPTFSAEVALGYGATCEAAGVHSFGGSVSKTKISLYLDNGVRIVGDVVSGGPETEVAIAGSGHWAVSS
ncbi:hypothetical protein RSOLAG22IIIB_10164 [Rhizoctonia solani]|uniref:Cyanovirin-N domain-containing protein n=1 Tax=Rhizoctonia solani TaxID=456999 RepID=A0A0K6G262_9AGAM|nr:hypothetical protein RSOLAG22IIIB_10164 [Rhizoctonia solani]